MKEYFQLKETCVWITADDKRYIELAKDEIQRQRRELERFGRWHPYFLVTLEQYQRGEADDKAVRKREREQEREQEREREMPEIVRRMIEATEQFKIGPMAAVAGTLAELAVEAMRDAGATYAMVDNGGDIALLSDREVLVGIYAGASPFSHKIALRLAPSPSLQAVCTSSGTVGHSISFGIADAATVVGASAALADAAATALGNAVTDAHEITAAFRAISHVAGITGALVIHNDVLATWGHLPEIVKTE